MLRSVYVSDSVTYIGKYYFRDCENLEHVYGMNKVDSIGELSFAGTKLLQKSEMRKDIVIELSYRGFSCTSDYS